MYHQKTSAVADSSDPGQVHPSDWNNPHVVKTGVPASGSIATSQLQLWFDDTDATPALNLKAKTDAATVVAATIPLAPGGTSHLLAFDSAIGSPVDGQTFRWDATTKHLVPTDLVGAGQGAIADLSLGSLVLIGDVITALGTVQTKANAMLSALRASGLIGT